MAELLRASKVSRKEKQNSTDLSNLSSISNHPTFKSFYILIAGAGTSTGQENGWEWKHRWMHEEDAAYIYIYNRILPNH